MTAANVAPRPVSDVSGTSTLRDDLACGLDPVLFARRLGITPDGWQADVLRSNHRRMLLNCSRQAGKSTVAGIVALHRAVYWPGSTVIIVSPSQRQSGLLFGTVDQLRQRVDPSTPRELSATTLRLRNGSTIVSLPGVEETVRGYSSVDLLVIDEAARVSDALHVAVRPMLAVTGGRLLAMSTPAGKRGFWSTAWHEGGASWQRVKITGDQCPRISPAFLADERRGLGPLFAQEYEGAFIDAATAAFRTVDIERATGGEAVEQWAI